jgi:hypothetical protein
VEDGEGGWLGTPKHNIRMDPDAPDATDEETFANSILLFPNPATNLLNIAFQQPLGSDGNIFITDIHGRVATRQTVEKAQPHLQVNLDDFSAGIYFLNVQTSDGVFAKKFVVAR